MIHSSQPLLGAEEVEAVRAVFASNWLGYGPRTKAFEGEFAARVGVPADHVLFLNSATAGLFLAMELLDVGPGDEVVMPSLAFVADGNAVIAHGARPVFCDVAAHTLSPTVADIERALTPRTKAVVVLHYGGYPCDIEGIAALCRRRKLFLIEDAAGAHASTVHGRGCGTFGDIGVWSFDARKVITTGDGGMLYVRDPAKVVRAHRLAYHGLDDRSTFTTAATTPGQWWALHVDEPGRRVIGNDLTAAIGSVQLGRLTSFVDRRRAIAELYDRLLADADGILLPPQLPAGHVGTHYFYWVQLDPDLRDDVAKDLLSRGIYTTFRYSPLHTVPVYGWQEPLPETEYAARATLHLPIHQGLDDEDVRTVAYELRKVVESRRE